MRLRCAGFEPDDQTLPDPNLLRELGFAQPKALALLTDRPPEIHQVGIRVPQPRVAPPRPASPTLGALPRIQRPVARVRVVVNVGSRVVWLMPLRQAVRRRREVS